MELFLLNEASPTTGKLALIGGIGLISIYGIYRLFSSLQGEEEEEDRKMEEGHKPAGIYNQGNTCFVNSLLQALASLTSFDRNLHQAVKQFRQHNSNELLITQLLNVIRKINSNSESIDVVHFLSLMSEVKEGLINFEQQDAHELFAAVIGCFDDSLVRQKRMDLSASIRSEEEDTVENYMVGYTKSSITCTRCRAETAIKIHPFNDLSLQIRPMHVNDVRSALKEFEKQEPIQSWTCTSCTINAHIHKLTVATRRLNGPNKQKLEFIAKAIIEHLQNQDLAEEDVSQVNQNLSIFVLNYEKQYLEMADDPQRDTIFVQLEGVQSTIIKKSVITKYPKILVIHLKQLIINPLTGYPQLLRKHIGFEESLKIERKTGERTYRLTSLLTHIGNQSMGHYYTFRLTEPESQKWYVISDSYSRPCEWMHVRQSRAYMLFYEMQ